MNRQQKQMKHPENKVGNSIWSQILTLAEHNFKDFFKEKHTNY